MGVRTATVRPAPDWATLFDRAPVGIAITGADDAYVYVNDDYARLNGHAASALVGRRLEDVARSPEASGYAVAAQRIRATGKGVSRRAVRVPFGANEDAYVDVQLEPLVGPRGDVEAILQIVVDVTDRIVSERRAAGLELVHETVLEQMTNGVVVVDRDGRIRLENEAARTIAGRTLRDLPIAALGELFAPRAAGNGSATGPSPLARALAGERPESAVYRIRRPVDGRDVWIQYAAAPLRDAGGEIVGAVATFSDVTTERRLREAIRASEDRLRRIYEAVACGLLVRDSTGTIVFANQEAARIFGVDPAALVGAKYAPSVSRFREDGSELPVSAVPAIQTLREATAVRDVRSRLVRADGTASWVRIDTVPVLRPSGEVEYVVTSFLDITERKLAEERLDLRARQQAAVAELGRRALAAHDLDELFAEAVRTINGVLGAEVCRVIEHDPGQHRISVRAGQRLGATTGREWMSDDRAASQAGYTLAVGADVIANDLRNETRFAVYGPIVEAGYNSTATVLIPGHERPFGVIAVISTAHVFADEDVVLVRSVANVLGEAIERMRAVERVRANEQRLRTIVANLPLDLMVYDAAGRITLSAGRRPGSQRQVELGESVFDRNKTNPSGLNRIVRALRGEEVAEEIRDGEHVIDLRHHPVLDAGGAVSEVIGLAIDVTDRAKAEAEVVRKEAFVRAIFDSVETHLAVLDRDGIVVDANTRWLEYVRSGERDLKDATVGDDYVALCRETDTEDGRQAAAGLEAVLGGKRPSFSLEFPTDRAEGRRWYHMLVTPMRSAEGGVVISHRDVTERKRVEDALEHQALHDVVTDLPNRVLLRDRLRQAILAARRRNNYVALLFIDLDRFKELNDTFGHQAGDVVLREVGERFLKAVRSSDTVARLGGDEFAVLIPLAADAEEALMVAHRVVGSLGEPFVIEGESAFIEASVGVVMCPEHGEDVQTLMRRADVAMYAAKRAGSGVQLYEAAKDLHSPSAIGLAGDLRHSIDRGELALHYQPIVDLAARRCVGMEALCRWEHPTRGFVSPGQFIPLAEEIGFIRQIGTWTIGEALRALREWDGPGASPTLSVNLSMRNLRGNDLPAILAELIERNGVDPSRLKIEITESAMMADAEHTLEVLRQLQTMGIRLSVDDFGTGYSSLAYLQRLPVDDIKVDRSFVLTMLENPSDEAIVRSTIELAHNLGLRAIAEGVENEATLDRLRELGCDQAQGYFIARPMPKDRLLEWLGASPWGAAG